MADAKNVKDDPLVLAKSIMKHRGSRDSAKVNIFYFCIYRIRAMITRSWILIIHKARILRKKTPDKMFLDFKKWVKSIQTAGYNGVCTVFKQWKVITIFDSRIIF